MIADIITRAQRVIYSVIDRSNKERIAARAYDSFMLIMIVVSILPLMFADNYPLFRLTELVTVIAFIVDYAARWFTAPLSLGERGVKPYIVYPFTPMAIIDLLSILPGLNLINPTFKVFRLTRLLKIVRLLKVFHYSSKISAFINVLRKERKVLFGVLILAMFYVFITALIMFNAEPRINPATGEVTFKTFFDALYWSTVTLTTVGYGDLCPATDIGRIVAMISSLFGVAIIALPSGVITAGYLDELRSKRKNLHAERKDLGAEEKN